MGLGQRQFRPLPAFVDLVLNPLDAAANLLFAPAMADGAGIGDVQQRALQVVVGELRPAFAPIRHVAIGAGHVAIGVDAGADRLRSRDGGSSPTASC